MIRRSELLFLTDVFLFFLSHHRLNTHLAVPEVVVIGKKGHGKTSLIEAIFGEPLGAVGSGNTKRPVFYNFLNNMSLTAAKITVKRDTHNKEFDRDVEGKC
jgi:GTP-binding protein EngB required for normal cell division